MFANFVYLVVTFSRYSGRMELPRAAKLIRMLDGEVLSAARALCRIGIHDVAERVENGPKLETAIRYARPRQTREIARLSRLVEELQSQVARFAFRSCLVCGKPFRAGRADASTCSARCRTRLCRHRKGGPQI